MSFRTVLVVLLALVCGVTAAIGLNAILRAPTPAAAQQGPETVPVVVAVADIGRVTQLTLDLVKVRQYPKHAPPGDPKARFESIEEVFGRAVLSPIVRGEVILNGKLANKGAGRGIEVALPDGMRAFTILTQNVAAGVAGFILPGSKVDVLLTLETGNSASTFVLLENVEILAVHQVVAPPGDIHVSTNDIQSVTLLVTDEQATELNLAQNKGKLHLSLRNPHDKKPATRNVKTVADLYPAGLKPKPAVDTEPQPRVEEEPPAPPPVGEIRILRGMTEHSVTIQSPQPAMPPPSKGKGTPASK